jgi:hypothetical protein
MANNIPAFKAEFLSLLTATANIDAATKTKLRNRFVSEYQAEWDALRAAGTADTAGNRADFAAQKVIDYMTRVYRDGSHRENLAAMPVTENLQ